MTIRHLKIFIEVYKTQNVTRASENLFMTQPTVTRAIQELEQHYGVRLFERINHRLYITEIGHQFYAHAVHIVDSFNQMEKELTDWDEFGIVRIGATSTLASVILPTVLSKFEKLHPNIKIKCTVGNGTTIQKMILDNELDFALIEGGTMMEHLKTEEFYEDKLILILPPNSQLIKEKNLSIHDLNNANFLLRENGSMVRSFLNHIFAKHEIVLSPTMESISTHAIIQAVHSGLGISFLPEDLVSHSVESGYVATKQIDDENFSRKSYIVWHENKFLTKLSKELISLFKNTKKLKSKSKD